MTKYSTALLLLAIILLAFMLRLYHLNYQSLWVDEIVSMVEADPQLSLPAVISGTVADQPPAFFIMLHSWFQIFNYTEYNGRFFSILIGLTGVVTLFFLGREVKGPEVGLVAALITALSYIHILFSQEVRFYTALFLFTALSYLFFIRCVKFQRIIDFVFYTFFTTVVLYTHYYGLVVLATQGILFIGLITLYPANKRFIVMSIISGVLITVMFIPWLPIIFSDVQTANFWIQPPPFYFPIEYFYVYFKDVIACSVFAILIIIYFLSIAKNVKSQEKISTTNFILIGWGLLSYLIPLTYTIIRIPMLHVRYTTIALPGIIIIISLGFFLIKRPIRMILLIVTSCTMLLSLFFIEKHYTKIQKEDWRGMISSVVKNGAPDDMFISEYSFYCNYYFKALKSEFRAVQPEGLKSLKAGQPNVWVLEGFNIPPGISPDKQQLVHKGYKLETVESFYLAKASLYRLSK